MVQFELTPVAKAHCERNGYGIEDMVGLLPQMLSPDVPAGAVEQFDSNYAHGGGWRNFDGFTLNAEKPSLSYPGDPPLRAIAIAQLRDERIILFESSWVAVVQPDGAFVVSWMG